MFEINSDNRSKQYEPQYPTLNALLARISNNQSAFPIVSNGADVLSIQFGESGESVRKVVRRSNYKQTHQLFSKKTQKAMSCESLIELNGCYILETLPEIKSYQMQPAVINYALHGESRQHFPDALVEFTDSKRCFIEFKSESKLEDQELIARTAVLGKNLPAHGYGYLVVCDDQVSGIPLANAKILFHAQKTKIPKTLLMDIGNMFDCKAKITIGKLLANFTQVPQVKNSLYQLMLSGIIGYDNEKLINTDSEIYWKGAA